MSLRDIVSLYYMKINYFSQQFLICVMIWRYDIQGTCIRFLARFNYWYQVIIYWWYLFSNIHTVYFTTEPSISVFTWVIHTIWTLQICMIKETWRISKCYKENGNNKNTLDIFRNHITCIYNHPLLHPGFMLFCIK